MSCGPAVLQSSSLASFVLRSFCREGSCNLYNFYNLIQPFTTSLKASISSTASRASILNIEDFLVDSSSSKIEIWDNANQKILKYDKNGNFLSEREFQYIIDKFCKLNENTYLCYSSNVLNPKLYDGLSYNVIILDSVNKLKGSFLPIIDQAYLKIGGQNSFNKYGNGVNVAIPFNDHIYHVTTSNCIDKYKINFTNYKLPYDILAEYNKTDVSSSSRSRAMIQLIHKLNIGSYVISIFNIFENTNYLFFQYGITDKGTFTVFLNKLTKITNIGIPENNIDSGLFGTPLTMNNDTLVTWFFPYELKARIKYIDSSGTAPNLHYNRLKQLSESVSDNDNPIIAKFSIK